MSLRWILATAATVVAVALLIGPLSTFSGYSHEGDRLVYHETACGRALDILLRGELGPEVRGSTRSICTRAARSRAVGAGLLVAAAGLLAWRAVVFDTRPTGMAGLRPIPPPSDGVAPKRRPDGSGAERAVDRPER